MVHTGACPIGGEGKLVDLAFDASKQDAEGRPSQQAGSRQVTTYSCGHSVVGSPLEGADEETLDVERRDPGDSPAPDVTDGEGERIVLDAAERAALVTDEAASKNTPPGPIDDATEPDSSG